MKTCLLTKAFLTKRRHQRQCLPSIYDVGSRIRLVYGNSEQYLANNTERKTIKLSSNIPSAFGATNLHITTRWCIEMLEKYINPGKILDVGTGAGILAICAAYLIHKTDNFSIEAFDIYQDAVNQAKVNLRLNGLEKIICLKQNTLANYLEQNYSLVIANLPPIAISELWLALVEKLQVKGIIILSGILKHNVSDMEKKFISKGLKILEKVETDLWCLIVAQKI